MSYSSRNTSFRVTNVGDGVFLLMQRFVRIEHGPIMHYSNIAGSKAKFLAVSKNISVTI